MNTVRPSLPALPERMRTLPVDERGYPVPFFVAWGDGKPDHRIVDPSKIVRALASDLCWICGCHLGRNKFFCFGPMSALTRTISEPPSHQDCARFAAQGCPFLSRPRAERREANMPAPVKEPAGTFLRRNPGVVCLWEVRRFTTHTSGDGGYLFVVGAPERTEWYAEGRPALRSEVDASITSGLPTIVELARKDGLRAMQDLQQRLLDLEAMLDAMTWPEEPTTQQES